MSPLIKETEPVKKELPKEEQEQPLVQHEPVITMSEEDAYILDRMRSQPKHLEDVLLVKERKYAPGEHRLTLPKELDAYTDRFAFRWINKKKRAIDEAITKGWVLVNRALFPIVARQAKHLFSTNGAVERGDCILAFMNLEIAKSIRRAPGEKSNAFIKSQLAKGTEELPEGQSGFYKPVDSSEKEDDTGQGQGLQEGRDF